MNWSNFKEKLKPLAEKIAPLVEKVDPLVSKAKDSGNKMLDFTQKQLHNTQLIIKTMDEYTKILGEKRVIIIGYDQNHPDSREIILRSPIWGTKAWMDSATLRLVEISNGGEIASHLGITTPIDMRVWFIGQETFHSTSLAEISKWWETRCYDGKNASETLSHEDKTETSAVQDPLAGK